MIVVKKQSYSCVGAPRADTEKVMLVLYEVKPPSNQHMKDLDFISSTKQQHSAPKNKYKFTNADDSNERLRCNSATTTKLHQTSLPLEYGSKHIFDYSNMYRCIHFVIIDERSNQSPHRRLETRPTLLSDGDYETKSKKLIIISNGNLQRNT